MRGLPKKTGRGDADDPKRAANVRKGDELVAFALRYPAAFPEARRRVGAGRVSGGDAHADRPAAHARQPQSGAHERIQQGAETVNEPERDRDFRQNQKRQVTRKHDVPPNG